MAVLLQETVSLPPPYSETDLYFSVPSPTSLSVEIGSPTAGASASLSWEMLDPSNQEVSGGSCSTIRGGVSRPAPTCLGTQYVWYIGAGVYQLRLVNCNGTETQTGSVSCRSGSALQVTVTVQSGAVPPGSPGSQPGVGTSEILGVAAGLLGGLIVVAYRRRRRVAR